MAIRKYKRTSIFSELFLVLCIILCLFLYELLASFGFSYTDEIVCALLLGYLLIILIDGQEFGAKMLHAFYVVVGVLFFYYVYSWILSINPNSITTSFIIHIKPFLTFFSVCLIDICLDRGCKQRLTKLVFVVSVSCLAIVVMGYFEGVAFFRHPAFFAMTMTCLALYYQFLAKPTKRNTYISIAILAVGLLSLRMKAVGFFIVYVFVMLFFKQKLRFKFNVRNTLVMLVALGVMFYFAKEKIDFYFLNPYREGSLDSAARAMLYLTMPHILFDYFPFGPGFGTYADYGSAINYSPIYYNYHLDEVFGLSPEYGNFICDAFYPDLAQFGIVGICLFLYFWWWIYQLLKRNFANNGDARLYKIGLLIIIYMLIESTTANTFVQAQGLMLMILLALVINEGKYKQSGVQ